MATANTLSMSTIFPPILTKKVFLLTRGKSVLDKLSAAAPIAFTGNKEFTFSYDNEIDIVGENGAKSAGGATIGTRIVPPVKVEYGMRVSDEFLHATEEQQIDYLEPAVEGFARKLARGRDLMAIHGINPRTGVASDIIGNNCFDKAVSTENIYTKTADDTADGLVEKAVALVRAGDYDVDGVILSNDLQSDLAAQVTSGGARMYPELAWGSTPDTLNGQRIASGSTVNAAGSKDLAIAGNFSEGYKWGYAKDISMTIIPYGDPDNTGVDLAGHNQIYLRFEAYIGWAILDPAAFAIIKSA